jgi:hypothetical protein
VRRCNRTPNWEHLALPPGSECDNGNRSVVQWDLVLIQTPAYGGGELYFDGQLLRKDGKFVPADLQC